jgi:integrase
VHPSVVEATLLHLLPMVADMVRLQQLTGMRSGELVVMRAIDIDTTGRVWYYRPGSDCGPAGEHKTAHHGYQRVVAIGPQGQAVVANYLRTDMYAFLFSPQAALAVKRAEMRQCRKTRVQPSQQNRRRAKPKVCPGGRYTVGSYRQAIERACDKAFPPPDPLAQREGETAAKWQGRLTGEQRAELAAWQKAHRWFPHQLRHAKGTEIRREFGLDEARAVLGHRSPTVTELYAELDAGKAAEVMEQLG